MSSTRFESAYCARPRAANRLLHVGRLVCVMALAVIAGLVIRELTAGKLDGPVSALSHAGLGWIAVAIAAEVVSYGFYAAAQRRLLAPGSASLRMRWLASLAVCAQAVNNFVPVGYAAANLLNFRELRHRGLSPRSSGSLLVMSSGLYIGVLACLTLVSAELAGSRLGGAMTDARIGAAGVLVVLSLGAAVVHRLFRRGIIRLPGSWQETGGRPQLSRRQGVGAAGLFAASWLADAGCLLAAIHAVGARPEWSVVPAAYCAAQLASFLPVTPGGLGLVEGSLAVTLMAGGGGGSALVLASVLLYRLISYWATFPCGVLGYLLVRRTRPRGSMTSNGDEGFAPALGDRALGGDRPVLVLGG
jgi:uncharacterized membrane protein YbhN (UPF0104 family)